MTWEQVSQFTHDMGLYRRRWDIQGGNWQVGRWEEEFTAGDGTSKMRRWDIQDGNWQAELASREQQEMGHPRWEVAGRETGRGILPQEMGHLRWELEMGHPRETNLPHDMGLPRPELAGREMGRGIYHMTWDFQGRNGTSKAGTGRLGGKMYHRRWELAGREMGRGI